MQTKDGTQESEGPEGEKEDVVGEDQEVNEVKQGWVLLNFGLEEEEAPEKGQNLREN